MRGGGLSVLVFSHWSLLLAMPPRLGGGPHHTWHPLLLAATCSRRLPGTLLFLTAAIDAHMYSGVRFSPVATVLEEVGHSCLRLVVSTSLLERIPPGVLPLPRDGL